MQKLKIDRCLSEEILFNFMTIGKTMRMVLPIVCVLQLMP